MSPVELAEHLGRRAAADATEAHAPRPAPADPATACYVALALDFKRSGLELETEAVRAFARSYRLAITQGNP